METLTIGRLAQLGGVNLETIRYYERRGLLAKPPGQRRATANFHRILRSGCALPSALRSLASRSMSR